MPRLILAYAALVPALLHGQLKLQIEGRDTGSQVRPGETVVVTVNTQNTYAGVFLMGGPRLNVMQLPEAPPFRFSIQVPADIVAGLYTIFAMACKGPGDCEHFTSITIDVEPVWPSDAAQLVSDTPGVSVDTGGVPVNHRSPIPYPREIFVKGIGGTAVVEVTPQSDGSVGGIQYLSGPEELRKDVIKTLVTWRFDRKAGEKPRQVRITFDPVAAGRQMATEPAGSASTNDRVVTLPLPASRLSNPENSPPVVEPSGPRITPQRIRVPAEKQATKLTSKVGPVYPPLAKALHIQGVVRFAVIITKDGRVVNIQLMSGHPLLVPAAEDAIKQWQYTQTLVNGTPVEVATQIEVEFFLPN
jgi:TonB family protein